MRVEDLLKYSGKNGDYYIQFLERFEANEGFFSWNWMAFFFFPFWLLYRKLWKQFFVLMGLSTFITFVTFSTTYFYTKVSPLQHVDELYYPTLMFIGIFILSIVSFPMFLSANANYLQKAKRTIEKGNFKEGEGRSVIAVSLYSFLFVVFMSFSTWFAIQYDKRQYEQKMARYAAMTDKTIGQSERLESKFEKLQKELDTFTYQAEWQKMEAILQKHNDLTKLSEVDYMFRVIMGLMENDKIELLETMVESNLSIPTITKVSGRDFVKYAYTQKKWKALKFLMAKGDFPYEHKIWMKENSYKGKRPLQLVVQSKEVETLKWLIKKGIPVKAKFYRADSPLMLATQSDNLEIIKILVDAGANPNYKNLKGDSAISYSQQSKNSEIRAYFDTKVSATTFSIKMLNEAIKKEDLALIKRIVASGIDVTQRSKEQWGTLPLEVAVETGNVEILDYLLSHGVDVNQEWNKTGTTTLKEMVSMPNALALMDCALKYGVEIDVNKNGYNALDKTFAPRGDWLDRANLLIENNASLITPINRKKELALHASLQHDDDNLSNLIIDKMVKEGHSKFLSSQDESGESPLNYAVWNNKLKIVKKLLKLGVNTKVLNKRKVQAISYATTKELLELLEPYSTHHASISDSYCKVYVEKEFDKSKIAHCQTTAAYYESTKEHAKAIWHYFLANDLEHVKRYSQEMTWIKDCDCHGYQTYMDIAHAYLVTEDMKNAKKYYIVLAELTKYESAKRWMKRRFEVLEGLHPGYGNKAKRLWHEVWKEKYKENFFEVYDVGEFKNVKANRVK